MQDHQSKSYFLGWGVVWFLLAILFFYIALDNFITFITQGELMLWSKGIYFTGDTAVIMNIILLILGIIFIFTSVAYFKRWKK